MALIIEAEVSDPRAQGALASYFAERAATFPVQQVPYRTVWPSPDAFTPPAGVFLLAPDDADPAQATACGGIRRLDAGRAGRYEVKHLWVRPAFRGRGLGHAILAELERRAAQFGAHEVVLDTHASLKAAGGLYRAHGYTEVEPYNDNPNATIWYAKRLG